MPPCSGVSASQLTADSEESYEICRTAADNARAGGDVVLFVPSASQPRATNIVVYPEASPANCQIDVGLDRVALP